MYIGLNDNVNSAVVVHLFRCNGPVTLHCKENPCRIPIWITGRRTERGGAVLSDSQDVWFCHTVVHVGFWEAVFTVYAPAIPWSSCWMVWQPNGPKVLLLSGQWFNYKCSNYQQSSTLDHCTYYSMYRGPYVRYISPNFQYSDGPVVQWSRSPMV
jgi:hypothetical protein